MSLQHTLRPLGLVQHVQDKARQQAPPDGQHDWSLLVQYRLTGPEAARMSEGVEELLDGDKITYWTPVVCMRCEHAHGQVAGRPCPGDPHRYRRDGRPEWHVGRNVWTTDPWRHLPQGDDR